MEKLICRPGSAPEPGPHETWQELADHSLDHDQLPAREPAPQAKAA